MLRAEEVSVRFGGLAALSNVTVHIRAGEVVGLVGPNGAGKTTFFDVISGLVAPAGGRVLVAGRDLGKLKAYQRPRAGVGRAFQVPQPLPGLTVRENLIVAQRFGSGRRDDRRRDEILETVGLARKAGAAAATELSLSEQKMLEVAKALSTEPRLLLLDEVLAGLPSVMKQRFVTVLERVRTTFHVTLMMIEHDIETIQTFCSRCVVLDHGSLVADGSPAEVFSRPDVMRSYTGG